MLSVCILDSKIARSLVKHPKLQSYDGTGDPYVYLEDVDNLLDYYLSQRTIKWNLFALTQILVVIA